MIAHRWQPITRLDSESSRVDFQEIDSLHQQWTNFREQREASNPNAYKSFRERLERRWAIENGIIEGLYTLDRGMTQTLVENGLIVDLIERSSTNRDPVELVRVLKDHQNTAAFVTESIRRETQLSKHYIRELHQILTINQPTYTAVDQRGKIFETALNRGYFKTQPNNPTRREDGRIHEYCPPFKLKANSTTSSVGTVNINSKALYIINSSWQLGCIIASLKFIRFKTAMGGSRGHCWFGIWLNVNTCPLSYLGMTALSISNRWSLRIPAT